MDYENQKIIVVDDDTGLSGVVCDYLQSKGLQVQCFASVEEARESVSTAAFDLLILDWDLPGKSGVEFCKEYREQGGLAPVLMMTGHKSIDDKELGLEYGADDYVTKPFSMRELHARIKSMLRRAGSYSKVEAAAEPVEPMPGLVIAEKYQLEAPIGCGGMAMVWKALDLLMSRPVVIKMMHDHLAGQEEALKRFEHESRLMAKIKHPNVVTIYDSGSLNNVVPYLVMEYVKGEALRELIDDRGAAPIRSAVAIMTQICAGLSEAHEAGIVHRDLKPENILIQDRSYRPDAVKIADFGIARLLNVKERVTKAGMVIGTIEYISPEQLEDNPVDCRADIYSLGIILFEMLTGQLPYKARSVEGMMMQHLIGAPYTVSSKRNEIASGSALDEIVAKCLQKKPKDRYQSANELREDLLKVL